MVPEVNMKVSSWYEPEPDRIVITDLDLFTESDDERERESEEKFDINPVLLDCIRGKELGKNSPHPNATSTGTRFVQTTSWIRTTADRESDTSQGSGRVCHGFGTVGFCCAWL